MSGLFDTQDGQKNTLSNPTAFVVITKPSLARPMCLITLRVSSTRRSPAGAGRLAPRPKTSGKGHSPVAMKEGGEGEGEPRFAGGRRARDARRRVPFHLMYRNHSGAVSVASRTSVRRWSTASVIACMGEESLLVWTCGLMTRNACQSSSMDARREGGNPKSDTFARVGTNSPWGRCVAVCATR